MKHFNSGKSDRLVSIENINMKCFVCQIHFPSIIVYGNFFDQPYSEMSLNDIDKKITGCLADLELNTFPATLEP